MRRFPSAALGLAALAAAATLGAQFERFGLWEVHYIAFNASHLSAQVAERYGIVRGPNKGLVNVSAMRGRSVPTPGPEEDAKPAAGGEQVQVAGRFTDLLGQARELRFREIDDAGTFYYLAPFDFPHGENLRFEIAVTLPGHGVETVRFQQPLYRSDR